MRRFATISALFACALTIAGTASATEWTPGQICQSSDATAVSFDWRALYSNKDNAYVICPVTRGYPSVSSSKAYVYNPASTTSIYGYANFVSTDAGYTNYHYQSTYSNVGNQTLDFGQLVNNGLNGFLNFELHLPSGGLVYGFYSN